MLVDSHCHLDFPELNSQLDQVLARAKENDIAVMQTISTKLSEADKVIAVAENHEPVYASVGVHPHNAEEESPYEVEDLLALTQHPKVIGIGETGLDYFYEHSNRDIQQESFRKHIQVSRETKLPLIVHTRDAEDDTIAMIDEEMKKGQFPGLIHCFTSTKTLAEKMLAHGFYISISGIITFKNAQDLRDVVKDVPLDRLLVETDAPYLAPVPNRGKTNEPAFTKHTAQFLADLKEITYNELAQATTENFFRLFNKVKPRAAS